MATTTTSSGAPSSTDLEACVEGVPLRLVQHADAVGGQHDAGEHERVDAE